MSYRHTLEFASAVSVGMKAAHARGVFKNAKRRPKRFVTIRCENCRAEKLAPFSMRQLKYCSPECSVERRRGVRVLVNRQQRIAATKHACALCLRRCGFGLPRIARRLQIGKATVCRLFKSNKIKTRPNIPSPRRQYDVTIRQSTMRLRRCVGQRLGPVMDITRKCRKRVMTSGQRYKRRYHADPAFRVYQLCRRRMKKLLHGVKRYGRCMELVGCTTEHLRRHIESQFSKGMSWANSGTGKDKWHIDHFIPCDAFDLTREDQQRICFHWTNLRPMWVAG